MPDILDRLRHAVTTACNDDYSEAGTEKRTRHIARIVTMQDASSEIEVLRSAIYKMQSPGNEGVSPGEFLTEQEKSVVRVAVTANL